MKIGLLVVALTSLSTSCTTEYLVRKVDLKHVERLVAPCPYTGPLISRCSEWPEMTRREVHIPAKTKSGEERYLRFSRASTIAKKQPQPDEWVTINVKDSARKPLIYTGSALLAAGLGVFLGLAIPDLLSEDDENKGYGMIIGGAFFGVMGSPGLASLIWGLFTDSTTTDGPSPASWPSLSGGRE